MCLTREAEQSKGMEGDQLARVAPPVGVPWEALGSDAGILAMLVNIDGTVVFANEAWNRLLNVPVVTGRSMVDLLGRDLAAERQRVNDGVFASGHPATMLAMMSGVLLRTTHRAIQSVENGIHKCILATSCVAREEMDLSGIPLAACHDLGHLRTLTERELELLHHVGRGHSSDIAADLMHRSTRTVEWHRASLGQKLGCTNRVEIARVALAAGITAVSVETLLRIHRAGKPRPA